MSAIHRFGIFAVSATLALSSSGCTSLSDSSASVSDFVSSPVTSLSRSSSPEIAYREDVRDYVVGHVQAGSVGADLVRSLGEVAKKHGISDWERNEATFRGIGAGLKKLGYNQAQVDGFKANVTSSPEQGKWLQRGYEHGV